MQVLTNVDFKSGQITFLAPLIDFNKPFGEQVYLLSEDLIQVKYGEDCILDVGWYPEFNENGVLVIQVIKNKNWNAPVFQKRCREKDLFFNALTIAVGIAEESRRQDSGSPVSEKNEKGDNIPSNSEIGE